MTAKKRVRLNFRLPKSLADKLTSEARRLGIPKSKLLRRWITEGKDIKVSKDMNSAMTAYHLTIEKAEKDKIADNSKQYGLTKGQYLSYLINANSNRTTKVGSWLDENISIRKLWMEGELNQIEKLFSNQLENLNWQQVYLYGKAGVCMANHSMISNACTLLSKNLGKEYYSKVLTAEHYLFQREMYKAQTIIQSLLENKPFISTEIVGKLYYLKGLKNTILQNYEKATRYFVKSLETYSSLENPFDVIQCYIFLSVIQNRTFNLDSFIDYKLLARELISQVGNKYLMINYLRLDLYSSIFENDLVKFDKKIEKIDQISKDIGLNRGLLYSYLMKGKKSLLEGQPSIAASYFDKALENEKGLRNTNNDGITKIFFHFSKSKDNFEENIMIMEEHMESQSNIRQVQKEYLVYTAKMLFNHDTSAIKYLEALSKNDTCPFVRMASQKTLETKNPQPLLII